MREGISVIVVSCLRVGANDLCDLNLMWMYGSFRVKAWYLVSGFSAEIIDHR